MQFGLMFAAIAAALIVLDGNGRLYHFGPEQTDPKGGAAYASLSPRRSH
jgi:hypothetical protein